MDFEDAALVFFADEAEGVRPLAGAGALLPLLPPPPPRDAEEDAAASPLLPLALALVPLLEDVAAPLAPLLALSPPLPPLERFLRD